MCFLLTPNPVVDLGEGLARQAKQKHHPPPPSLRSGSATATNIEEMISTRKKKIRVPGGV